MERSAARRGVASLALAVARTGVTVRSGSAKIQGSVGQHYSRKGGLDVVGVSADMVCQNHDAGRCALSGTYGGMRLMSVEDPQPGQLDVGFVSVVSRSVQFSPL